MLVIYVQKSWLKTFGDIADFIVRVKSGNHVSLLAGTVIVSFPFVEAELNRKEVTEGGDEFLPARIPTSVISEMFTLTKGDVKKLGFHRPEEKSVTALVAM